MEWVLIGISLLANGEPVAQKLGEFEKLDKCFYAREYVIEELGGAYGYPPVNTQLVCIKHTKQ